MALRLLQNWIYLSVQLEALWILIWIASAVSGSTFIKNPPKDKDSTFVPDGQTADFNIVNSSFFTFERPDDFLPPERKSFNEDYIKDIKKGATQKHDNTSTLRNSDIFIKPKILFHQENKQNVDISYDNDKQDNFKTKEQKHISQINFSVSNETVMGSKVENKGPFHHVSLNNRSSTNSSYQNGQIELIEGRVGVKNMQIQIQDNLSLNKSIRDDKLQKSALSDTALFNKYLIAERKKASSHYNSTLSLNKQKIFYHDASGNNESSLMNDQPLQGNVSDEKMEVSIKSSNARDEEDNTELNEHNSTTVDDASNETIYNDSSLGAKENMIPSSGISFNTIVIAGISLGVVIMGGIIAAGSYVIYRHRYWNKPQTLSDKCSNADSSGYIDDSTLRENSEEMYSLDNDSFLNSLEAMTIQNYWTDNVKHTKL